MLLPKGHHLSELVIRHFHSNVHHQGRQITSGAVSEAGYWVIGAHRMISRLIESCVTCKRLRGATLTQHMANLPTDRLETCPPFTNVGLDVFGPWEITKRRLSFVRQDLYARNWWRKAQYLANQFWVRWRKEYLQNLQKRPKWTNHERKVSVGDIVLVKEDNAHRNNWLLGQIPEVMRSSDGKVRRAKVKTSKEGNAKTYDRPIASFVLLLKREEE